MMKEYNEKVVDLINTIYNKEEKNISAAAKIMFDAMQKGLLVHVFATGHSHMFAEELFYRACGLVQIDPMLIPELMQHEGAVRSTALEREAGRAETIFNSWDIKEAEPIIIVSNSGINAVPVEMAALAKEKGHSVIVVTSYESSCKLTPRNKYNKHLYDFADVVIDNHAPYGDGAIEKPYGKVGAVSSILGNYIAQNLVLEVISLYEENGLVPPVYQSANTPGGDEHNKELMKKYQKRIKCLY